MEKRLLLLLAASSCSSSSSSPSSSSSSARSHFFVFGPSSMRARILSRKKYLCVRERGKKVAWHPPFCGRRTIRSMMKGRRKYVERRKELAIPYFLFWEEDLAESCFKKKSLRKKVEGDFKENLSASTRLRSMIIINWRGACLPTNQKVSRYRTYVITKARKKR